MDRRKTSCQVSFGRPLHRLCRQPFVDRFVLELVVGLRFERHAQRRLGVRIRLGADGARDQEDDGARADESPQHCLLQAIRSPPFGFAEYRNPAGRDIRRPPATAPNEARQRRRPGRREAALGLRSMGFVVFVISGNPVLGDGFLRGRNIKLAAANHVAHDPFQPILGLGIPFRLDATAGLRPEI